MKRVSRVGSGSGHAGTGIRFELSADQIFEAVQRNHAIILANRCGDQPDPAWFAPQRFDRDIKGEAATMGDRMRAQSFHRGARFLAIERDGIAARDFDAARQAEDVIDCVGPDKMIVGKVAGPTADAVALHDRSSVVVVRRWRTARRTDRSPVDPAQIEMMSPLEKRPAVMQRKRVLMTHANPILRPEV